jgi:hypothetical protein
VLLWVRPLCLFSSARHDLLALVAPHHLHGRPVLSRRQLRRHLFMRLLSCRNTHPGGQPNLYSTCFTIPMYGLRAPGPSSALITAALAHDPSPSAPLALLLRPRRCEVRVWLERGEHRYVARLCRCDRLPSDTVWTAALAHAPWPHHRLAQLLRQDRHASLVPPGHRARMRSSPP